jgi:hypothetical protein
MAAAEGYLVAEVEIDITIKGLEAIRHLVAQVPDRLPLSILQPTLEQVAEVGEETMKMSIMRSTGEKATGRLAGSIDSALTSEGEDQWLLRIGSPLAYARFPARDIGATPMFRPVQIDPPMRWAGYVRGGKWRFIGIRPPIPRHPFLDETAEAVTNALGDVFGDQLRIEVREVESETKARESIVER